MEMMVQLRFEGDSTVFMNKDIISEHKIPIWALCVIYIDVLIPSI